jgi:anti-sigma factor RsiW
MALTCSEIGKLVHPYLDGEFSDEDRVALETHTQECDACRELVQYEMAFKASMRAKLSSPRASSSLRRRVLASLDEVDRITDAPAGKSGWLAWLLPATAMTAAAAAIVLFVIVPQNQATPRAAVVDQPLPESQVASPFVQGPLERFVQDHRERPVAVPDAARLRRMISEHVGVSAELPQLSGRALPNAAKFPRINGNDVAQLTYKLTDGEASVFIFADSARINVPLKNWRRVADTDVQCGGDDEAGFSQVFYSRNGVSYLIISDEPEDEVIRQLEQSWSRRAPSSPR